MRAAIKQRLIEQVLSIDGRVVEIHDSFDSLTKPYVVAVQGADGPDTLWTGLRTSFEIWSYVSEAAGFAEVDGLTKLIISALDGQVITDPDTDETFTCQYEGNVGADKVDTERNALTRGLRFAIISVSRRSEPTIVQEDAWLVALSNWTHELLDSEDWQVYCGKWPTDYVRPSILWRLEGAETTVNSRAATIEVRKKVIGHVIGRSLSEQTATVLDLAQGLTSAVKIPLDVANRRYLTVLEPIVDLEQETMTEGQLSVTLSRKIDRQPDMGPLMSAVNFNSKL